METKTYKKRWGDRSDGRLVRGISPMAKVSPYIMSTRVGSLNYIRDSVDMGKIDEYIAAKKEEGYLGFGFMHVLVAAYLRMVAERPGVNRFIAGQKIFSRNNFEVCLTIKKEMNLESPDTCVKVELTPECTAVDVYNALQKVIDDYRNSPGGDFDDTAKILSHIPGLVMKSAIGLLRLMDYFGCLPKKLLKLSPFHGSLFITSMGSLGIPPIYHHLYDFGNVPVFCSFGAKQVKYVVQPNGAVAKKRYIDLTFVMDERICDGYYFASALKMLKQNLQNPYMLDEKPRAVLADIE